MKKATLTLLVIGGALLLAPAASAHVTVNPNSVAADSFSRFAIRVPNERPSADTTKVVLQLPEGLFFVSFQPKPGWKRTVTMEKLDPPVDVFGEKQTERVATVTWEGGTIAPGEFDEFGMSVKVPARRRRSSSRRRRRTRTARSSAGSASPTRTRPRRA